MKARGKREAKRERVAPGERKRSDPALKARNTRDISAFQALLDRAYRNQGRRASPCPALAPGFHIPRLWRSFSTFRAKHSPELGTKSSPLSGFEVLACDLCVSL
jgi:hypothetical protein